MDEEERAGPPPLTDEVVKVRAASDFESPGRTDTEGIVLDRSSFPPPGQSEGRREDTAQVSSPETPGEAVPPVASDVASILGTAFAFLLALVVCLMPALWRDRIERTTLGLPLRLAAFVTGVAEMAVAILLGLHTLLAFAQARLDETGTVLMDHVLKHDVMPRTMYEMHQVQGAAIWVSFMLSPTGLFLGFLLLEGTARVAAATVGGETMGLAALWLVEKARWLLLGLGRRSRQQAVPTDRMVRDGQGTLVSMESAHRHAWDRTTTLRFEGRLYVVEELSFSRNDDRPYRYRVREAEIGHLVRGVTDCDPEE